MGAERATSSFAGDPQPVEVFHAGAWLPGELLGWRHDEAGNCRVRVRVLLGGLRHSAWTDLDHLRLPERPLDGGSREDAATRRPAAGPAPAPARGPRIPHPRRTALVDHAPGR